MSEFIKLKANKMSLLRRKPLFGVGINDADYMVKPMVCGSRMICKYYVAWKDMLNRCYCSKYQEKHPSYNDCKVCDEWLTFSNFKLWMEKQDWTGKDLDKDLLIQGNKTYSPEACLFIPQSINKLLTSRGALRGQYPVGVCYHKATGKYAAKVWVNGKRKNIGLFDKPDLAHEAYKLHKYAYIKEVALQQVDPLRSALLKYEI